MEIRSATLDDASTILPLAQGMATSFVVDPDCFLRSLPHLVGHDDVHLTVADDGRGPLGYCLAFDHWTFYANGRVTWVEEIAVVDDSRGRGVGRALIDDVRAWAAERDSRLVALATRRAGPFYERLGFEESAAYYRMLLD